MFDVRRQEDHYHYQRSWLETDWHFSFGEYRDPNNVHFGPLRVVNHDTVSGGGGWGMHSHEDMEIITWIINGELTHEDTTGSKETVGRHGVQKMSAGSGVSHSEYNASETDSLRLLQIWIEPSEKGIEPAYEDNSFSDDSLTNQLVPVASGRDDGGVSLVQDAAIYVTLLDDVEPLNHRLGSNRLGYGIAVTDQTSVNDVTLQQGDAVRIQNEESITIQSNKSAEFMLIDLPSS
jgi:redox-sensitive bicupin YhaK (pirin superfamily)